MTRKKRDKAIQIQPSAQWWFARGIGKSRGLREPIEAATAGNAIRIFAIKTDDLTVYGPYGSKWAAWLELQKWLATFEESAWQGVGEKS